MSSFRYSNPNTVRLQLEIYKDGGGLRTLSTAVLSDAITGDAGLPVPDR
jgi:hypothetical protein